MTIKHLKLTRQRKHIHDEVFEVVVVRETPKVVMENSQNLDNQAHMAKEENNEETEEHVILIMIINPD